MQLSVILLSFIIYSVGILCEDKAKKYSESKHKLEVLGFIHIYKVAPDSDLKYPGLLVSPIILVPAINWKQHMNPQLNQNENEMFSDSFTVNKILLDDNNDIEVTFRQALDKGSGSKKALREVKASETIIHSGNMTKTNITENTYIDNEVITTTTPAKEENVPQGTTSTSPTTTTIHNGPYANASYNNQAIESLTITTKGPDVFAPTTDVESKNFTTSTNISLKENITSEEPSDSLNITRYPSVNETNSPIKGVYPAALYNSTVIDQLSIMTNSYTNGSPLPPPQDERWKSFASLRKISSTSNEFRPLAGLYYDGFLHKPILMKQGFVPYNRYEMLRSLL